MAKPRTVAELKASGYRTRSVKDEMRENLLARLRKREELFPGIVGYEETVIPQMVNAILSRHNMILLGLRGQAKTRILRSLVRFLDEEIPVPEGCEINDHPLAPLCKACRERRAEIGDEMPVQYLPRHLRYVEKLATPDVTIADMIGDIDPIKAAKKGLYLSDELTIHFGLLPRANRGIFALNELPDLAPKIQVGLLNIMEEQDVQVRGYPVRLPLDVVLVFSANPEDYTARGKIITPLKDRIGSEIRTHYPQAVEEGLAITEQEAWLDRVTPGDHLQIPRFVREVVEQIAFQARKHPHVDKQSGVSQRVPITCLENVVSNAERRAALNGEERVVPRMGDLYFALPAITGKIELEYEGEVRGNEEVARELIRSATAVSFSKHLGGDECRDIVEWFNSGHQLQISADGSTSQNLGEVRRVPGLMERIHRMVDQRPSDELALSAAEFILEGLHAHQLIGRSEEREGTLYGPGRVRRDTAVM